MYHGLEGSYPNTIYFEKGSFWKSLRELCVKPKDDGEKQTKEIDKHSIFTDGNNLQRHSLKRKAVVSLGGFYNSMIDS